MHGTRARGTGIRLFSISGIEVTLDFSWFFIFALVFWALTFGYFPYQFPGARRINYWIAGGITTFFLFFSIFAHELTHSFVAKRSGLKISEITFFIFGGISKLTEEARDPKTEIKIAAAGPLCSFALALIFWGVKAVLQGRQPLIAVAMFQYLAWINVALGVFNLVPGFPLDGGRIFRAIWWWRSGSLIHATRVASDLGKGFALALMFIGGVQIFMGALIGGLWSIFIGMFLRGMAVRGYQELVVRQSIEGVHVSDVMTHNVVTVPYDVPVSRLISDYFIRYCYRGFPVEKDGTVSGIVNLADIKDVPEEQRNNVLTGDVMVPVGPETTISPDVSLAEALRRMTVSNISRLVVMQGGRMTGMITKAGLFRFLEIKQILAT